VIGRSEQHEVRFRLEPVERCPVCGGPGEERHTAAVDRLCHVPGQWDYHRCVADGNLWLGPRPIPEDLGLCYPGAYFTHSVKPGDAAKAKRRSRDRKERLRRRVLASAFGYSHLTPLSGAERTAGRLLGLLPPVRWEATHHLGACLPRFVTRGRLLDVGCGNGQYLARMQGYGWETAGVEIDPEAAEVARREHGLTVHTGTIEDAPYPERSFDVITCQHVLEHIGEPRPFLEGMARFLRPGGRLVVVTPNAASLGHRLFGRDCYSLDPPRHLVIHTPASIRRLVGQVPGLQVASLRAHPRIARKIYLQRRILQRTGAFRGSEGKLSVADRASALLFAYTEALAGKLLPLGEEIELVASTGR
jgi:2-polyprenyl-3-methyl-5-hydroxy-6-metoxy-1,4-benzoquinol methylase